MDPTKSLLEDKKEWIESYRDLLDRWELFSTRAKLDIYSPPSNVPQLYIKCTFCLNSLSCDSLSFGGCPKCKKPLPRCALCLLHMGHSLPESHEKSIDDWFSFCIQCQHGGHALHVSEWFQSHSKCPVSDCVCHCFAF